MSPSPATPTEPDPDDVEPRLYVVYLGGEVVAGRMGEDHEVVLVAATTVKEARRLAKRKWKGVGRAHVDALAVVHRIDGHDVRLEAADADGDEIEVDPTYVP
jgi:hypothetical protein